MLQRCPLIYRLHHKRRFVAMRRAICIPNRTGLIPTESSGCLFSHNCLGNAAAEGFRGGSDAVRKPHHSVNLHDLSRSFVVVSLQMPPLWGLGPWLLNVLHRCHPSGIQEGFWSIHSLCLRPSSVRKPNLPGLEDR